MPSVAEEAGRVRIQLRVERRMVKSEGREDEEGGGEEDFEREREGGVYTLGNLQVDGFGL